jgi:serine/threonine-protein kinase
MTGHRTVVEVGEHVQGYRIEGLLGSGGMGRVYLARDEKLRRVVALKLVNPDHQNAEDLLREAQLAASLDHPSICRVHGVGYHGGDPFLVMEHVRGVPLSKAIRGSRALSFATVRRYALAILDAIAHAHRRGIIHGDLKSSNVMVSPGGHITILDFGLAVRLDAARGFGEDYETTRLSPCSGAAGTMPYMAPEIIRGQPPSVASDIWALGVLLFEMATGRRPFSGATPYELAANILSNQRTPMQSALDPRVRGVVDRCLAIDPARRFSTVCELRSAVHALPRRRRSGVENRERVAI